MRRRLVLPSVLVTVVALGACSGGNSTSTTGATNRAGGVGSGANTAGGAGASNGGDGLPDPCTLLSDAQVQAAIGTSAPGRSAYPVSVASAPSGTLRQAGCTWGDLTGANGVLGIQISKANGGKIDALTTLIANMKTGTTPVDVGAGGAVLLSKALIPFGGGEGRSITWKHNGATVVVGLVRGDQPQLEAAARAVNDGLG